MATFLFFILLPIVVLGVAIGALFRTEANRRGWTIVMAILCVLLSLVGGQVVLGQERLLRRVEELERHARSASDGSGLRPVVAAPTP